jgi:outer membrane protein assembly factor BamB
MRLPDLLRVDRGGVMRRAHRRIQILAVPIALTAVLAVAAPAGAAPGDWWQFGYTAANTRFNPNETTINEGNVVRLIVGGEHAFTPGEYQHHTGGVAVANGLAYVQAWDETGVPRLLAYQTSSFQSPEAWRSQQGKTCGNRSPTVHLAIVFVGSRSCRPSSQDGGVFAFDGATGQLVWSFTYDPAQGVDTVGDAGNVAATNGVVYFRTYDSLLGSQEGNDNNLWALDARTGAIRWQVQGAIGAYFGDPAVAGGRVFVGTATGRLQARSAATGALLWSRPGATAGTPPAVTGGMVYSTGLEAGVWKLFARSVDTGALRWTRALPSGAGLAVAGARVVVATSAGLSAFDAATGTPRWSVAVAAAGSPAVANGLVYLGLQQGIGAWRLSDGVQRWRFGTIGYGSPVVSGGRLYVSGFTSSNGQQIEVVDQFQLGAAATAASS